MILTNFLLSCYMLHLLIQSASAISSSASTSTLNSGTIQTELEPINGTLNYRISGKKGKDDKPPWFDGLDMRHTQCVRRGRCVKLEPNHTVCLGSKLPYEYTSLDLTDCRRQREVTEVLQSYRALRHVPKCWAVVQPFLCAVFKPKCEEINGVDMVYLPSLEMCRITLEPCRILYNTSFFPKFLRCNETLFPPKCSNDVREMKFNVTGSCLKPLVSADSSYYPGIEGCGVQCKDPFYTDDEHRQIQKLISWGGTICFLSNLFVVATFFIDWENASKYPALIVFYINLCFLIASVGWMVQFTPGSREDIVCRKDGTLRHSEPTAGENLSCIVVFVLVYYFLTAAMVWFVFLTYAWHLRAVGNVQDRIDKKGSYFHLVAWSLPLVLTITTMALSEVDGNSIVGICFVGYMNHSIRTGLLLGPLCCVILIGGYFIIRGMIMLIDLKHFANDIQSALASNKIHLIIVRMGVCAILSLIFILVVIACHITEFKHSATWKSSFHDYIICRIASVFDENSSCKLATRPSVAVLQLHLLCLFGTGVVMSTWCWTPSSIETWKRFLRKKCGKEITEEVKMPKHKIIAQTWAKRKEFEDKGRLSITLYNTHTDPVGLNIDVNDLNSSETNEISSTWANYLPQFVKRRMALTGAAGATNSSSQGPRKNSLDSEISFSVRHVSVESRRNSVDSQVSVKIAEMKTKVASRTRNGHHHHHHHHSKHVAASNKRTQRRRDFIAATSGRKYSAGRRESSTSIESQIIALKNTTYPNASHKVGLFAQSSSSSTKKHNSMKRRSANVGLDAADIGAFLAKNGQLILPFLQNQGMTTSSDEEASRASFKIRDSRLDVVLKQEHSDDGGDEMKNGAKIEEIYERSSSHTHNNNNSNKKQAAFEQFLKHMQKSGESTTGHRHSRNSTRSRQSQRKTQGASGGGSTGGATTKPAKRKERIQKQHKAVGSDLELCDMGDFNLNYARQFGAIAGSGNDISDTYSYSSVELDMPLGSMLHSSYSGMSTTGKPNSRNSKTSCDVGIQANAYEIANHTMTSYGDDQLQQAMRLLNAASRQRNEDANDATEMHTLLSGSKRHQHSHNKETMILSESERLKMLLLPSK